MNYQSLYSYPYSYSPKQRLWSSIESYRANGVGHSLCRQQLFVGLYELDRLERRLKFMTPWKTICRIKTDLLRNFPIEAFKKIADNLSQSTNACEQEYVLLIKQTLKKHLLLRDICEERCYWCWKLMRWQTH